MKKLLCRGFFIAGMILGSGVVSAQSWEVTAGVSYIDSKYKTSNLEVLKFIVPENSCVEGARRPERFSGDFTNLQKICIASSTNRINTTLIEGYVFPEEKIMQQASKEFKAAINDGFTVLVTTTGDSVEYTVGWYTISARRIK